MSEIIPRYIDATLDSLTSHDDAVKTILVFDQLRAGKPSQRFEVTIPTVDLAKHSAEVSRCALEYVQIRSVGLQIPLDGRAMRATNVAAEPSGDGHRIILEFDRGISGGVAISVPREAIAGLTDELLALLQGGS